MGPSEKRNIHVLIPYKNLKLSYFRERFILWASILYTLVAKDRREKNEF
jgi:hypothetical protein